MWRKRVLVFCYSKFIGQIVIWVEVKLCVRHDISREHKETQQGSLWLKNKVLELLLTYLSSPWRVKSSLSIPDLFTKVQTSSFLFVCLWVLHEFLSKLSVALVCLRYTRHIQCISYYVFRSFKTKRRLHDLKPQSVPRCKHFSSVIKTNQFML
jgi:hypothetical protein